MTEKKKSKTVKNKNTKPRKEEDGNNGRPSKLTDQVIKDFTDAIAEGAGYALAADWAKISEQVALHWMREGRKEQERRDAGDKPDKTKDRYLKFLMAVKEAKAEAGLTWQQVVNRAAKTDPQWADRMLKYRYVTDYATIKESEEVEIPKEMSIEYLQRIIAGESPVTVIEEWKRHRLLLSELNSDASKSNTETT